MTYLGLSRLSFPQAFQRLYGVVGRCDEEAAAPARERLEALFLHWPHLLLASGTPLEDCRPGLWTVDTAGGLPVFTFLTGEANEVATVVFPAPERRIGLRALWYWRRRRARDFWFCELEGWRRKDAEGIFVRHLFDRALRPLFRMLPGSLAAGHWEVPEALVKLALARRGRSETREVWERRDSHSSRSFWIHSIEQDNLVFPCVAAPRPGQPLRIVHYVPSLAVSGLSSRVVERACEQARLGHVIEVVTAGPLQPGKSKAAVHLAARGIASRRADGCGLDIRTSREIHWDLLRATPGAVREQAFHVTATLLRNWPEALHCWSHAASLEGAVAGFTAGVPRIVLHFLDELPGEAASRCCSGLAAWYGILARSRRVQLLADSHGTAASWASAIGVPRVAISVCEDSALPEDSAVDWGPLACRELTAPTAGAQLPRDIVKWQKLNRRDAAA